jgi:quercetin dioxygenase-like cupin family protein
MRLSLYEFTTGADTAGGQRVVYDVANDAAHFGAAEVDGHALVWQLDATAEDADGALLSRPVQLDPFGDWILRCDRVDFPPGGIAYTHTHPGPGIRYLLHGRLDVTTDGHSSSYGPGGAWFEPGPEPVLAESSLHNPTAFVRVLLLPAEWAGKRTIKYVNAADEDRPKLQTARVYLEHPLRLHVP